MAVLLLTRFARFQNQRAVGLDVDDRGRDASCHRIVAFQLRGALHVPLRANVPGSVLLRLYRAVLLSQRAQSLRPLATLMKRNPWKSCLQSFS